MGIHYNHKSKEGDRKMQKELKRKMRQEARKQKKIDKEQAELDELEKAMKIRLNKKIIKLKSPPYWRRPTNQDTSVEGFDP